MEKIFADKQGNALFCCPHCGFTRQIDASSYRDRDSRIKIKCRCGETVSILIEFRKFFRKEVELYGQGLVHTTATGQGVPPRAAEPFPLKVEDLSMDGLRFSLVQGLGVDVGPFAVGDMLTVKFRLDNRSRDLIERKGVIRNLRGSSYGVNFLRAEYDKELGFYLMR